MKFKKETAHRQQPTLDLTPMIDVVFQLLIFFMLSATFVVQSSVQIEMPQAKGATNLEKKELSITLAYGTNGPEGKGKIYIDETPVESLEEFTQIVQQRVADSPDILVLIRPDSRSETGRLVQVLGILNSLGITKSSIAAEPADE
ncbi:MAG TPA: biopolymer transporter ExbD [Candidatus Hydrogenedentes bacterium]|nr:biopolymer transporter ExbD [Candidatus Hydrogenedentota bacterium]